MNVEPQDVSPSSPVAGRASDRRATYLERLAGEKAGQARLRRQVSVLVVVRLAALLLVFVSGFHACSDGRVAWAWFGLAALGFVVLSLAILDVESRSRRHGLLCRYYEDGLARLDERPLRDGATGEQFGDPEHPYAVDMDLFGRSSLFSLLCVASTAAGQATLARWLKEPASRDEVLRRQQAVEELRDRLTLREQLWLAGGAVQSDVRAEALQAWLAAPASSVSRAHRILTAVLGAAGVLALWALGAMKVAPALAIFLLQRLVARKHAGLTRAVTAAAWSRANELRVVAAMADRWHSERFTAPRLLELSAALSSGGQRAVRPVRQLARLVRWLELRSNPVLGLFAAAVLLGEQLAFAIEAWRGRHGKAAAGWIDAIGEIEALCCLATFAYEHPTYPFPVVLGPEQEPRFRARALGHPLIPSATRVTNDVHLDGACRLLMVTGSNMSGKSTLLRTVGSNSVLALAGAPVCAEHLELTCVRVAAALRAQDSLEAGVSRFFAEIRRLRTILTMAKENRQLLFLLDEILNGTNSQDRKEGAEAVIRALLGCGAIGIVTTHDLALVELAGASGAPGQNVHFQDRLEDGKLVFDYRMQAGVATRRNALDLMRLVGIEVAEEKS